MECARSCGAHYFGGDMERRWRQRQAAELDVMVYHQRTGLLRCIVRDLSYDGARIDTGGAKIPVRCYLDLEFQSGIPLPLANINIEAYVVRCRQQEIGVMFRACSLSAFRFLKGMVASG